MRQPSASRVRVVRLSRVTALPAALLLIVLVTAALAGATAPRGERVEAPAGEPGTYRAGAEDAHRDLRYGPAPAQTLDVTLPAPAGAAAAPAAPAAPAILLVHGGGWFAGDKQRMAPVAAQLADAGFVVFNVNYTLATRERPGFPVQPRELRQALRWIGEHAAAFGADSRRLGALGSSAGGNLVALVSATQRLAATRIRAVVTWSAPLDLSALADTPTPLRGLVSTYTGCRTPSCAQRLAAASPLQHVTPDDPPLLLVNARAELMPAGQARRTAAALDAAGVERELLLVPGAGHGRELAPAALEPSIVFLRRQLR